MRRSGGAFFPDAAATFLLLTLSPIIPFFNTHAATFLGGPIDFNVACSVVITDLVCGGFAGFG